MSRKPTDRQKETPEERQARRQGKPTTGGFGCKGEPDTKALLKGTAADKTAESDGP